MDADYDIFEVVTVTKNFWLFDAECYQRKYITAHGQPLDPGYYVVNWPEHVRVRRFDDHAAFHGPFVYRHEAQAALDWMSRMRESALNRSSTIASNTCKNYSRKEVMKTSLQKQRRRRISKHKQFVGKWDALITGFPVPTNQ